MSFGKADAGEPPDYVQAILDHLHLDWGELTPDLKEILVKIATDGVSVAFKQVGVDAGDVAAIDMLQQANAGAIAFAKERAAELVTMISEATRGMIRSDVVRALEEGWSNDQLADALEAAYAFSAARAETIARTETAIADVQGNLAAWKASGVVKGKKWVLGSEHEEQDECDDAAALGVVPLDSTFGGLGDPPAHPRCVCDVFPVVDEPAAEDNSSED